MSGEERFECGCAASNVEYLRDYENPNKYHHIPFRNEQGERLCPIHHAPLAAAVPSREEKKT